MEDSRVKETHQRQKHVSIGFVQVNRVDTQPFLQNLNKKLIQVVMEVLRVYAYLQCHAASQMEFRMNVWDCA